MIRLFIILIFTSFTCAVGFGQNRAIVDFEADIARPIKIGDSTVYSLVGNVVFHHNGAIIVCDSAIRYSDKMMECYNNVIINKDSTFIYGDRADYNGLTNIANVYSPIVKLIDGDVTLYSYNLDFNTLTSIGRYTQGGTITQKDNLMESIRATYHSKEREVFFVNDVEMKNDEYIIKSDSMGYAFDTEVTTFYKDAKIWNKDGDFLSANKGSYHRAEDTYIFTDNSYILTKEQQIWADSITYKKSEEISYLFNKIQILDETQKVLSFGDYGVYWSKPQDAILTRNPSIISFDTQQGPDSTFTRADSIFISTIPIPTDSILAIDSLAIIDSLTIVDSLAIDSTKLDSLAEINANKEIQKKENTKPEVKTIEKTKRELRREERQKRKLEKRKQIIEKMIEEGMIEAPPKDTIAIDSSKLKIIEPIIPKDTSQKDSLQRIIRAYRDVKIFRTDFQAVCDSLVSFSLDSTTHLYINPVLWSDSSQVVSEIMHIFSRNQQLDKAEFEGYPIMIQQVNDSLYNQVSGRIMYAFFKENTIYKLDVNGNAQTYYYMQNDNTGDVGDFLAAESANITFQFDSSRISGITYREDVSYVIYPLAKIPEDQPQKMKDFKWEEQRRPITREDVFNRTLRPSQRKESMEITKPMFPMTQNIFNQKQNLTEQGVWRDRSDRLWINQSYFNKVANP